MLVVYLLSWKFEGLENAYVDSQNLQYSTSHVGTTALLLSQNGLRSTLRASDFQKFPGGTCPHTPLVLHAYAQITQTCKPPSKSPGYWPGLYSSLASQTQPTPAWLVGSGLRD